MNIKNKSKKNIILSLSISVFLVLIFMAAYAIMNLNYNYDETNIVASVGTRPIFTATPSETIALNIPYYNIEVSNETEIANGNSSLNIALSTGYDVTTYCTYDIIWEWDETSTTANQYQKTTGATKEYTVSGTNGTKSFNEVQLNNYNVNNHKTVLYSGEINVNGTSAISYQQWDITAHFYKTHAIQSSHQDASYSGKVIVDNVVCNSKSSLPATDTITALASETGAGATDGHPGAMVNDEYGIRYIGENPSNFVWFNCSDLTNQNAETCERWRIIGVFDEKYDSDGDNIPDTTGPLIKIIRNDSLGDYRWDYKQSDVGSSTTNSGSNDWSDSQLMMMLNPPEFLNSGYVTEEGAATHSNTISGEYVVSNGINIYRNMGSYFDEGLTAYSPANTSTSGFTSTTQPGATFTRMSTLSQSMIATVKWHLTGTGSYTSASNGLASHFYAYERNDPDGTGYVYTEAGTRPKIWYGKVGLMYPSDYGFATSGDASVSGYDRASCLNKELYNWYDESYQTYCAYKDWLLYVGATGGTSATKGSASDQWTITASSYANGVFSVSSGYVFRNIAFVSLAGRPVLYLKAGVSITEGSGTYDSPYKLSQ